MIKIVFLDRETLGNINTAPDIPGATWVFRDRTSPEELLSALEGAEIAVTNKVRFDADALAALPKLQMISVAATGYNVIDVAACHARGVTISNVGSYAANTVPEHTFALLLSLRRNLAAYRQDVINGAWQASGQFCFLTHDIRDLAGSRLGLIGRGALGQRTAELGRAFGMDVVFAVRKGAAPSRPDELPFHEVLATSDVISLHVPLSPETDKLLSAETFALMKRRPIIINTARGELIDETALAAALDTGQVSAAGLDVLSQEPPTAGNPLLNLLAQPNVIVTPHVAWASHQARQSVWNTTLENIRAFLDGCPQNVIP